MSSQHGAVSSSLLLWQLMGNIRRVNRCRRNGGCRVDCDHDRTSDDRLPWETRTHGGWGGHEYHGTEPGTDRTPVVFVHGLQRDACDWEAYAEFFRDWGYGGDELWAITLGTGAPSHDTIADQLDEFVGNVRSYTGAETVSVVGHSLGGTGLRYWLHREDRYDWVDDYVSLAAPHHGTKLLSMAARNGIDSGSYKESAFLRGDYERFEDHPLTQLNADETPGDVDYYTVRGTDDPLYVDCAESPTLEGATNVLLDTDHEGARTAQTSMELVYEWVSGRRPYNLQHLADAN